MIEQERESNSDNEKNRQRDSFIEIRKEQRGKVNQQNQNFSRDHVSHDRADKESFFAFEDYFAGGATLPDDEGSLNNRCAATHRTAQLETAAKCEHDRARVSFHLINPQISQITQMQKALDAWITLQSVLSAQSG